jgi:formylglycine-generating enzyme required for sulfatase activity
MLLAAGCDRGGEGPSAPVIITQPSSVSVAAGQRATFTVTASGTGPLSYQWQSFQTGSWVDIPKAVASTYTTPATAAGDFGSQFRCIVSNMAGSATSIAATLMIGARYMVIDLSSGTVAVNYPIACSDSAPADLLTNTGGPGGNSIYKTTHLVLRRIPAGTFTMGSPVGEVGRELNESQHQVTLTQDFYIGVFPVTQEQYRLVTDSSPSWFSGNPANPVECLSWNEVRGGTWPGGDPAWTFMTILRTKTDLWADLPTEAQWEYACRAGTTTALNNGQDLTSGDQDAAADAVAWYYYNSGQSSGSGTTMPVGGKLANAWGLYDMHGNVREWCLDWLTPYHIVTQDTDTDPRGWRCSDSRALRGGGWYDDACWVRSAMRLEYYPSDRGVSSGFRVVVPAGP